MSPTLIHGSGLRVRNGIRFGLVRPNMTRDLDSLMVAHFNVIGSVILEFGSDPDLVRSVLDGGLLSVRSPPRPLNCPQISSASHSLSIPKPSLASSTDGSIDHAMKKEEVRQGLSRQREVGVLLYPRTILYIL